MESKDTPVTIAEIDADIAAQKRLRDSAIADLARLEAARRDILSHPLLIKSTPNVQSKKTLEVWKELDSDGDLYIRVSHDDGSHPAQHIYISRVGVAAVAQHLQNLLAASPPR